MSSRNVFLQPGDRRAALSLVRALAECERHFEAGERDAAALLAAMRAVLRADLPGEPDYVHLGDPDDLSAVATAREGDVALLAARVGRTRLIDNHVLGARIGGPF
jgi:pantoate--beta-alanine ligase